MNRTVVDRNWTCHLRIPMEHSIFLVKGMLRPQKENSDVDIKEFDRNFLL